MPLLTGSWKIVADGHVGELSIVGVSSTGQLQFNLSIPTLLGLVAGGSPSFVGFWDESSQTITFQHVVPDITPNAVVIPRISLTFTGHLFKAPVQPAPGQDVTWTLAGSFVAFNGPATTLSTSRRNRFGWVATISQSL